MKPSLIETLDVRDATQAETGWLSDQLPPFVLDQYIASDVDLTAEWIRESARLPLHRNPADVLLAHKWRHGRRPVALLSAPDRILYRAVVSSIQSRLPEPDRSDEAFARFKNSPTEVPNASHVVTTDVSNFFSSIPIDSLGLLISQRVGNYAAVSWLEEFWHEVSGRSTGIPQVNQSSDVISEVYAGELERRVLQRGVMATRFADDFRFAAVSRNHAVQSLEIFDEEARELGLFVNERKTRILEVDDYSQRLKGSKTENDILEEARESLQEFNPYTFELIDPEKAVLFQEAARRSLRYWQEGQNSSLMDWDDKNEAAKQARRALQILGAVQDTSALSACESMMDADPQNTASVCRYLRDLSFGDSADVLRVIESMVANLALSKWQRYWVLYALEDNIIWGSTPSTAPWVISQTAASQVESIRTYACWVLARHHRLDADHWRSAASGLITDVGSPTMSAALSRCSGLSDSERTGLVPGNFLDRRIFEWADGRIDSFIDPI